MRKLSCLIALVALLGIPCEATSQTLSSLSMAQGSWELSPETTEAKTEFGQKFKCSIDALHIRVDESKDRYYYKFGNDEESGADVLVIEESYFAVRYDDETRLMENGEPHIWYFYLKNPDEFVWIREDWIDAGNATASRRRCQPSIS